MFETMIPMLNKEGLLDIIKEYDSYIQWNVENNEEFGISWFPVCINEFYDNEYQEILFAKR